MTPDPLEILHESEHELSFWTQLVHANLAEDVEWHPQVLGKEVDFLLPGGIIVEIQGQVWKKGAHTFGRGYIKDRRFANKAQLAGYVILEFTPECINDGTALQTTLDALEKRVL